MRLDSICIDNLQLSITLSEETSIRARPLQNIVGVDWTFLLEIFFENEIAYLIPIKIRAPLTFAHLACAKIKGSKFAQYECAKIKGRRKMPQMNEKTATLQ